MKTMELKLDYKEDNYTNKGYEFVNTLQIEKYFSLFSQEQVEIFCMNKDQTIVVMLTRRGGQSFLCTFINRRQILRELRANFIQFLQFFNTSNDLLIIENQDLLLQKLEGKKKNWKCKQYFGNLTKQSIVKISTKDDQIVVMECEFIIKIWRKLSSQPNWICYQNITTNSRISKFFFNEFREQQLLSINHKSLIKTYLQSKNIWRQAKTIIVNFSFINLLDDNMIVTTKFYNLWIYFLNKWGSKLISKQQFENQWRDRFLYNSERSILYAFSSNIVTVLLKQQNNLFKLMNQIKLPDQIREIEISKNGELMDIIRSEYIVSYKLC